MKSRKFLGGLVVVAVLLSGTTVLYFAGVDRPGVTPALAEVPLRDPGGACGSIGSDCLNLGGFCAVDLGMGGGCNSRPCCPPGQTYCGSDQRRPTMYFQEVGSPPPGSIGSCWKYSSNEVVWCILNQCFSGNYVCPSSACLPSGSIASLFQIEPEPIEASCACVELR